MEPPLPIRFHILFHAAIRAELDRLDEEVRRIEAQPVGAKDFHALGLRCQFLHDVYQYHSRLEDEVRHLRVPAQSGHFSAFGWLPLLLWGRPHLEVGAGAVPALCRSAAFVVTFLL